jgi:hypothetical protein
LPGLLPGIVPVLHFADECTVTFDDHHFWVRFDIDGGHCGEVLTNTVSLG